MDASKRAAVFLAAPGCLLALGSAIALSLAAVNRHPMWSHEPVNLAEAAGTRDEAEVVRLVEQGEDPNARYPVRPGLLFGDRSMLTPLEAAVARDDPAMVTRLLAKGAIVDAALWASMRCVAGERVAPVLEAHRPPNLVARCEGGAPPEDKN